MKERERERGVASSKRKRGRPAGSYSPWPGRLDGRGCGRWDPPGRDVEDGRHVDLEAQAAGAAWSRGCELGLGSKRGRDVPSLRDSSNSSTRPTPLHRRARPRALSFPPPVSVVGSGSAQVQS
jgi:hypothetical protein